MRYGFPYKGSKNKLASKIIDFLPEAANFYDLFAGGFAVTHAALISGKYKNHYANDINPLCVKLFDDAVHGKYKNETRWISREEFNELKDKDGYIVFCWSFGNTGNGYLYSNEIEPWKKALHYARVYKDFSLFEEMGIELKTASSSEIRKNEKIIREKYVTWYVKKYFNSDKSIEQLKAILKDKNSNEKLRLYLVNALKKSGLTQSEVNRRNGNQMSKHYFGKSQWQFPTREEYQKMQEYLPLDKDYNEIYGLQCFLENFYDVKRMNESEELQRLQRLQSLKSLQRLQSLEVFQGDYRDVKIKPDSLIYCDIPYKNTDPYSKDGFDYDSFYGWAEKQTELVFISSYEMPENNFVPVAEFAHRSILCAGKNNKVTERIFIPKRQIQLYEERKKNKPVQTEFNFDVA